MSRPTLAILSTQNLLNNVNVIKQSIGDTKLIAMVKANAYGHDLQSIAPILDDSIDIFGVACIEEAMLLRRSNIQSPILLAQGIFEESDISIAASHNFHITFHNALQVHWLMNSQISNPIHAWLKIDTGCGRLGFNPNEAGEIYDKLLNHPRVASVRIMSHFACANELHHPQNKVQIQTFQDFALNKRGTSELSICNSAAIFNFPGLHYDYVRPGIALYGGSPLNGISAASLGLKPVMTLQTSLFAVKNFPKGAYIGYNSSYQCAENMPIGIAPIGYGDGYAFSATQNTPVLVNNIKCNIVGAVSMDMVAIDLSNTPSAKIGDKVTLWGESLPIEEVAPHTSEITWRLLAGLSPRVHSIWI